VLGMATPLQHPSHSKASTGWRRTRGWLDLD
jgi:hypothetical protein